MTEEDTFNALRRVPFDQMFHICDPIISLEDGLDGFSAIFEARGWTPEEFFQKLKERTERNKAGA